MTLGDLVGMPSVSGRIGTGDLEAIIGDGALSGITPDSPVHVVNRYVSDTGPEKRICYFRLDGVRVGDGCQLVFSGRKACLEVLPMVGASSVVETRVTLEVGACTLMAYGKDVETLVKALEAYAIVEPGQYDAYERACLSSFMDGVDE